MNSKARFLLSLVALLMLSGFAGSNQARAETPARDHDGSALAGTVGKSLQQNLEGKKKVVRKVTKQKVKKPILPWGLGIRLGVMPLKNMYAVRNDIAGQVDYDLEAIWGFGINGEYRFNKKWTGVAEFGYFFPQVDSDPEGHPCDKYPDKSHECNFNESDGLFNLGVGVRFDFLGSALSKTRLYGRFVLGLSSYIADDANQDDENRTGVYVNPVVGFEQLIVDVFAIFVETGYYHTTFWGPEDEERAALNAWNISAGFMAHF